tara:strand:+ start:515 stop:646 length:132 start_codon:yes stop_codon:yes gene_type:complete
MYVCSIGVLGILLSIDLKKAIYFYIDSFLCCFFSFIKMLIKSL